MPASPGPGDVLQFNKTQARASVVRSVPLTLRLIRGTAKSPHSFCTAGPNHVQVGESWQAYEPARWHRTEDPTFQPSALLRLDVSISRTRARAYA